MKAQRGLIGLSPGSKFEHYVAQLYESLGFRVKTTLLERLKYEFAKPYLTGNSSIIPIYLPLKRLADYDSLDTFLKQTLLAEFEREIPPSVFWRALAEKVICSY